MRATKEQREAVMEVLSGVSGRYLPDAPEAYRGAVFQALYKLAIQRVIPPEIRLNVELATPEPGTWALRFSQDFMDWLRGDEAPRGPSLLQTVLLSGQPALKIAQACGVPQPSVFAWAEGRDEPDVVSRAILEKEFNIPGRTWDE